MSFQPPNLPPTPIPASLIPPGWTTDPEELAFCTECFGDLAQTENYDTPISGIPRALLADDKSGSPDVLVEVSDPKGQHDRQYYIFNHLSSSVFEVLAPKTAKDIVPLLAHLGNPKKGPVIRELESIGAPVGIGKPDKPY